MGRPELGTKQTCAACQERFYDLNRLPAICPKCGTEQPPAKARLSRPPRNVVTGFRPTRRPADEGDETEPEEKPEAGVEDDEPDLDEELEADIEIDPDRPEATD